MNSAIYYSWVLRIVLEAIYINRMLTHVEGGVLELFRKQRFLYFHLLDLLSAVEIKLASFFCLFLKTLPFTHPQALNAFRMLCIDRVPHFPPVLFVVPGGF